MNELIADGAARADLTALEALQLLERLTGGASPAAQPAAPAGADALDAAVCRVLALMTADVLKLDPAEVPAARPLVELGLDSIGATDLMGRFNERFGLNVPSTVLFEFDNLADLARHVTANHAAELRAQLGLAVAAPVAAAAAAAVVAPAIATPVIAPPTMVAPASTLEMLAPVAPPAAVPLAAETPAAASPAAPSAAGAAPATAAAPRRREVQSLWAEIEAQLDAQATLAAAAASAAPAAAFSPAPPAAAPVAPATDADPAWADCQRHLARLFGRGRAVAFPGPALADAALPALAGLGAHAGLLLLSAAPGPGDRLDPHHESALETLLARAGGSAAPLFLTLDVAQRGGGTPTHLLRAIERLRARGALLLGLADATLADPAALAGLARALEPDYALIGAAPFVALHLSAPLLASADAAALDRHAARYRNDYAAAELAARLAALDTVAGQPA
ncbi:acyl carrier protein [Derxia lacustris]|uniref:acyl carrier protein n=1 Tax=Derxia lacustris TaxID=764842 RepID=UPI000A17066F|nr:acyl carrier protein [Derxia lacustris]